MIQILHDRLNATRKSSIVHVLLLAILAAAGTVSGQTSDGRTKNNPYFPSPNAISKHDDRPQIADSSTKPMVAISPNTNQQPDIESRSTIAQQNYKIVKNIDLSSFSPAEIYKIGIGDIISVNLKNAANASSYYTVQANGTIDFPLAGENRVVTDKTTNEVESMLAAAITLYADPQVEVKIREFGSHKINVTGMVERPGETSIQREAIPLYVVCAGANVDPKSTKALIRRSDGAKVETIDLHEANSDKILIYPGNSVEFTADGRGSLLAVSGFYYIAGEVNSSGQKEFNTGMTLFQAILASGGAKGNPKKASVRRKTDKGTLNVAEYNLRAIKAGKAPDPILSPGDMIEVSN